MKLQTTCEATIWRGFFGKDEDGNHDECPQEIVVDMGDVHEDEVADWELVEPIVCDDQVRVWFSPVSVRCGSCDTLLEWPQQWTEAEDDAVVGGAA